MARRTTEKTTQNPRVPPDAEPAPGAGEAGGGSAPADIHREAKAEGGGDPAAARGRKGETVKAVCNWRVKRNGKRLKKGETLTLPAEEFAKLAALGAVSAA